MFGTQLIKFPLSFFNKLVYFLINWLCDFLRYACNLRFSLVGKHFAASHSVSDWNLMCTFSYFLHTDMQLTCIYKVIFFLLFYIIIIRHVQQANNKMDFKLLQRNISCTETKSKKVISNIIQKVFTSIPIAAMESFPWWMFFSGLTTFTWSSTYLAKNKKIRSWTFFMELMQFKVPFKRYQLDLLDSHV